MKTSVLILFLVMGLCSTAYGQSEKERTQETPEKKKESVMQQEIPSVPDDQKVKISASELPQEVHLEVRDFYYNGDIVEAYKIVDNGKHTGYIAVVQNGPEQWTLQFDEKGNIMNKIVPNK